MQTPAEDKLFYWNRSDDWEDFCDLWWGRKKLHVDPHSRSIELGHPSLLAGSNGRLLVIEEYALIFERVDEQYHETPAGAALILGEPGTGKTLCLLYILIRLLMRRTNVVCLYKGEILLFYEGYVYTIVEGRLYHGFIPQNVRWSLIDMDFRASGDPPNPLIRETFFVVQANRPDATCPARWTQSGRLTGIRICVMPLWNCEDLLAITKHDLRYESLEKALQRIIFPREAQDSKAQEEEPDAEATSSAQAIVQKIWVSAEQMPEWLSCQHFVNMDDAMLRFVEDTTFVYGFAVRDILRAVYSPEAASKILNRVFRVSYSTVDRLSAEDVRVPELYAGTTLSKDLYAITRFIPPPESPPIRPPKNDGFFFRLKTPLLRHKLMLIMLHNNPSPRQILKFNLQPGSELLSD